jgi:hypothetical protein
MTLADRVRNIVLTPRTEWPVIAGEAATVKSLYVGYIAILSAIGPIAIAISSGLAALPVVIAAYVIGLAFTYVIALIIDALAPTFGGEKNFIQSLKLIAYAYTAAWLAGIAHLIPWVGTIVGLVASLYSFYTFYLGVATLKKCPQEKALVYSIVVAVCFIVLGIVVGGVLLTSLVGGSMGMAGLGRMH